MNNKKHIKVLIIGNSITKHSPSPSNGWLGSLGMAATSAENDYVHILISRVNEKHSDVEFKWENIYEFEKYFYDYSKFDTQTYKPLADYGADIIIATFGANIRNVINEQDSGFETDEIFTPERYSDIIEFFNPDGKAEVLAGITTLTPYENAEIIKLSAQRNGYILVDMSDLTERKYTAADYKENSAVFTSNVIEPVLNHPGNLGMEKMAERIFMVLTRLLSDKGDYEDV